MSETQFKLESNFDKVAAEINEKAEEKVESAVHVLRNEVLDTLSGTRSGKQYPVPSDANKSAVTRLGDRKVSRNGQGVLTDSSGKRYYTASAPGEPPASRTGLLRATIGWYVESKRKGLTKQVVGRVGSPLDYAVRLEKDMDRKFLHPSYQRKKQHIKRILGSRWL